MTAFDAQAVLEGLWRADADRFYDDAPQTPIFDAPLVAVAAADDPWWGRLKAHVGDFYWTPQDVLDRAGGGATARSVICYVLPVAEVARRDNRSQARLPARRWAFMRTFGEHLNDRLRAALVDALRQAGHAAAAAPSLLEAFTVRRTPQLHMASVWSDRHAAFVAGLGTFGISGGLITARGIAHRLGSVVTDAPLPVTPRPYGDDPFAWCLKTARGTCGACIARCPVGSIGPTHAGRDKEACFQHALGTIRVEGPALFGWQGVYGCGLCQTAVPCEHRNPMA